MCEIILMSHTFHSKSQTILIGIFTIKSPLVTYIYICHRHVHAKTEAIRGDDSLLNNYTANGVDEKPSLYEQTLYIYYIETPLRSSSLTLKSLRGPTPKHPHKKQQREKGPCGPHITLIAPTTGSE